MAKKYVSLLELLFDTVENMNMKSREDYGLQSSHTMDRDKKNVPLFSVCDDVEQGCMLVRLNMPLFDGVPWTRGQEFECPYILESYFWQPYSEQIGDFQEKPELDLSLEETNVLNQMAILQVLNWYVLAHEQKEGALLQTPNEVYDELVRKGRVHELDKGRMLDIVCKAYEKFEPFAVSSKRMVKACEREWFMAPISTMDTFHILKENYEKTWQAREIGDSRFQMALPLFVAFHKMERGTKKMRQMDVEELKKYKEAIPARMCTEYRKPIVPRFSYGRRGSLWTPGLGESDLYLNVKVINWALKDMEEKVRSQNVSQLSVKQIGQIQNYQCERVAIHLNEECLQWDEPVEAKDGDV